MPSSGIHALTGILVAGLSTDPYFKLGAIVGAILPDADLLVSSFFYLATGKVEAAKKIHRGLSHSLIGHGIIAMAGGAMAIGLSRSWGLFFLMLGTMMAVHALLDMIALSYMTHDDVRNNVAPGVALLAPFQDCKFALWPKVFSDRVYNLLLTNDFLADPFFYWGPLFYFSWHWQTDQRLWWWLLAVAVVFFSIFLAFWLYAFWRERKADAFTVAIYYPGIFSLAFTLILPLFFLETLQRMTYR